jgi:DUF4097 and DUF4098 domain-containing protein YvlB
MTTVRSSVRRALVVPALGVALVAASACDIVTADYKAKQTAEWRKTYELQPGGRVEISNVNGRIEVEPASGNMVEVIAQKTAKGATEEAAKAALERVEIKDEASAASVKVETKLPKPTGFFRMGGVEVRYIVRVPASAQTQFTTVNGEIELAGLSGRVNAETTNGGIKARDVAGPIVASTTNGGVDVDVTTVAPDGIRLECTNGGIRLRVPADAKASIAASITNGGIETSGLQFETIESSRRRFEGRLNGGGPAIRIDGTNGGIRISSR